MTTLKKARLASAAIRLSSPSARSINASSARPGHVPSAKQVSMTCCARSGAEVLFKNQPQSLFDLRGNHAPVGQYRVAEGGSALARAFGGHRCHRVADD